MSEHIDRFMLETYAEEGLPDRQRETVEMHLADCTMCQARLADARRMSALMRRVPRTKPAPHLAARINAAVAAQAAQRSTDLRREQAARWTRNLVLAMFVAGLVLMALALPSWSGWGQATILAQLPTEQATLAWLGNLIVDPGSALDDAAVLAEGALMGAAQEANILFTLATVLLASASIAGLAQLLMRENAAAVPLQPGD